MLLRDMGRTAGLAAFVLVVALVDDPAVFICGVPDLRAVPAAAFAAFDLGGKHTHAAVAVLILCPPCHLCLDIVEGRRIDDGFVPVYGSGGIMTYIDTAAYDQPSVLIPRKDSLDKLYYVDEPFWNVDTIFYTDIKKEVLEPKYLYYWLQGQHLEKLNKAGGVPSLTQTVLNSVNIPVPPLAVQREIVRILDKFSELTSDLTSGLPAEIEARKKQYEYYRDKLLDFKEIKISEK